MASSSEDEESTYDDWFVNEIMKFQLKFFDISAVFCTRARNEEEHIEDLVTCLFCAQTTPGL